MVNPFGFKAERRSKPVIVTFPVSYRSEVGLEQPTGRPEQRIEHGLKVKCRTADNLEHVGSRGLLLQRLREQLSRVREFASLLVKLLSQVSCGGPLTGGSGLLLPRLFRFAGEIAHLLLRVGSGWGRNRASLGPIRAPTLDRLLASTALPHFAPLGRVTTRLKLTQILGFVPWQV